MDSSIGDLKAQLSFASETVRVTAFASLIKHLDHRDEKKKKEYLSLFWRCINDYGDYIGSLAEKVIENRLKTGHFSDETVDSELMTILDSRTSGAKRILRLLLDKNGDLSRKTSKILVRVPEMADDLVEHLKKMDWERARPAVLALIFSENFPDSQKIILFEYLLEKEWEKVTPLYIFSFANRLPSDLLRRLAPSNALTEYLLNTHPDRVSMAYAINPIHLMSRSKIMVERTEFVSIAEPHPCHLPSLLAIVATMGELAKVDPELVNKAVLDKAKQLIREIQDFKTTRIANNNHAHPIPNFEYSEMITEDPEILSIYLNHWKNLEDPFLNENSLSFLIGALSFIKIENQNQIFELLKEFCCKKPEFGPVTILCLLTIYSKPWFVVPKETIIKAIGSIARAVKNTLVIPAALRFLLAVCQKKVAGAGNERLVAIKAIGELFIDYNGIFEEIKGLCSIQSDDEIEWAKAKLELVATICRHSELSDELLPSLSALLSKGGPLLPSVLEVIKILCEEGVFEIPVIVTQSRSRSQKDPLALAEHLKILAISRESSGKTTDDLDEEEIENQRKLQEFALETALPELWKATENPNPHVSNSAFQGLSKFSLEEIYGHLDKISKGNEAEVEKKKEKVSDLLLDQVIQGISVENVDQNEGASKFLHHAVAEDLETLGRPLYTKKPNDEDPLYSVAFSLYETRQNQEANLGLLTILPIVSRGISGEKRVLLARSQLAKCLLQINEAISPRSLSAWRSMIEASIEVLVWSRLEASQETAIIWARDQLAEELKRALLQSEDSLPNVLIALIYLALKMNTVAESCTSSPYRPWLVSVIEFLRSIENPDHQPQSNPIFQCLVKTNPEGQKIATFGINLLAKYVSKADLSFYQGQLEIKNTIFTEFFENRADWVLDLLEGKDIQSTRLPDTRQEFCLIGYSLGLDAMTLEVESSRFESEKLEKPPKIGLFDEEQGIAETFTYLAEMESHEFEKIRQKLRKPLDSALKKRDPQLNDSIFRGLTEYSLSLNGRIFSYLPSDYTGLPENSLLRAIEQRIRIAPRKTRLVLLKALVNQCRKNDGRPLPPMDLSFLIKFVEDSRDWCTIFELVVQQKLPTPIARLVSAKYLKNTEISPDDAVILALASNFEKFCTLIPARNSKLAANHLLNSLDHLKNQQNREVLLKFIRELSKIPIFCSELVKFLDTPEKTRVFEGILWKTIEGKANERVILESFESQLVNCWLECSRVGSTPEISRIVGFLEKSNTEQRSTISCLLGRKTSLLSKDQLMSLLAEALTQAKVLVARGNQETLISFWPILLSLICSAPLEIPFNFITGDDEETIKVMCRRVQSHLEGLLKNEDFSTLIEPFITYLLSTIPLLKNFELSAARDCLRILIGKKTSSQVDSDQKWSLLLDI